MPLKIKCFLLAAVVAKGGPNWRSESNPQLKIWPLTEAAWQQFDAIIRIEGNIPVLTVRRNEDEFGTYKLAVGRATGFL